MLVSRSDDANTLKLHRSLTTLATVALLFVSSGATCIPKRPISAFAPPTLFQGAPDVQQLLEAINRSRAIVQLQSNAVTIDAEGIPKLSAKMVWERPKRFRMTGGLSSLTGTEFDLGSNDEYFWMSTRRGPSPTVFYARHDQFAAQVDRQILPVSPEWLIEALGVVELDPNTIIGTPHALADGQIEIKSTMESPIGPYRRTIVVDPKSAVIRRVMLQDPSERLIATSSLSNHQYYSSVQVSLPRNVQAQLIPIGGPPIDLTLDVGYYTINDNQGQDPARWAFPDTRGYQAFDLAQRNAGNPFPVRPPEYQPAMPGIPNVSYRGVTGMEMR
jgi:hypothetical protein